jgi:hypothetical protein
MKFNLHLKEENGYTTIQWKAYLKYYRAGVGKECGQAE